MLFLTELLGTKASLAFAASALATQPPSDQRLAERTMQQTATCRSTL